MEIIDIILVDASFLLLGALVGFMVGCRVGASHERGIQKLIDDYWNADRIHDEMEEDWKGKNDADNS